MKIYSLDNAQFKKRLKAKCKVLNNNNEQEQCRIYRLEPGTDDSYFKNLRKKPEWESAAFLDYAIFQLPRKEVFRSDAFVIENEKEECIGFCELSVADNGYIEVIETCPKYRNKEENKESRYKYIGETMLAFLAKQAKETSIENILLTSKESTIDYYKKLGFKKIGTRTMRLYKSNYDSLIENNEKNTESKIDFYT